jgi:hypothetical protein
MLSLFNESSLNQVCIIFLNLNVYSLGCHTEEETPIEICVSERMHACSYKLDGSKAAGGTEINFGFWQM